MFALWLMPVMPVGWGKVRQGREGGAGEAPSSDQLRCYPCGNFSDTSTLKLLQTKGAIGHAFTVCINTENQNQVSFLPFCSSWDFRSHWVHLRTPALSFDRCATSAKLSTWQCFLHELTRQRGLNSRKWSVKLVST